MKHRQYNKLPSGSHHHQMKLQVTDKDTT